MDAIKGFNQSQKSTSPKNLNHRPKDVANGDMGTQFMELNETIRWILREKIILKMLEDHVKWTTGQQVKQVKKYRLAKIYRKLKVWI